MGKERKEVSIKHAGIERSVLALRPRQRTAVPIGALLALVESRAEEAFA
jgi:hypothetical protein